MQGSTFRDAFKVAACACLLAQMSSSQAGNGRWTSAGPFGGRVDSALAGPLQPGVVFATTHRSVYRSIDSGDNWTEVSAGLSTVTAGEGVLAAHPTQAGRLLLAGARGVFGTLDNGRTWLRKDLGLPTNTSGFRTVDVAYAKSDPSKVYVATEDDGLFRSSDGGSTWVPVGASTLPTDLDRIAVDPVDPLKLLVWALDRNNGDFPASLYKSVDGGVSFVPINGPWDSGGPINEPLQLLKHNPNVPGTVFLASVFGNFRSLDGGTSFQSTVPLPVANSQRLQSLDFDPTVAGRIVFGSSDGVLLSLDNGNTFLARNSGLSVTVGDPASIGSIVVDPANSSRWLAFSVSGDVFASINAGLGWNAVGAGLRGTSIQTVAVHPTRPQRVYAGLRNLRTEATSAAFYLSDDTGLSWLRFNSNLALDTVNAIVFDPITVAAAATTRMFALGADFAPLGQTPASYRGGVFRSLDGGLSWNPADTLVPTPIDGPASVGEVNALLVDPLSGTGGFSQTLYFGANGRVRCIGGTPQLDVARIWRSLDGSASWTPRDSLPLGGCTPRLTYPLPTAMVFQVNSVTTIYAGTRLAGYCLDCGDPVPNFPNGVFKSIDAGQGWVSASAGLPLMSGSGSVQNITALVNVPGQPGTLYVALADPTQEGLPGRVFKTVNGGLNWQPADNGIANVGVRSLRVDPISPNRIYAGAAGTDTSPGAIYFTDDGGANWFSISIGLPIDSAQSVAVSTPTVGPPTLHAGTDEGVWSLTRVPDGDIDGPADADEDLAPNAGDGNNDGIADRLQTDVASIHIPAGFLAQALKGTGKQSTISNIDLFRLGAACQQIFDGTAVDPESLPEDVGFAPDAGLLRFEFINCASAQVLATFHDETFDNDWVFRRFGPLAAGNPLGLQWLGMGNGAVRNGQSFTLTLVDNAPGDLRSEPGRILFIGGPVRSVPLFRDGFEGP